PARRFRSEFDSSLIDSYDARSVVRFPSVPDLSSNRDAAAFRIFLRSSAPGFIIQEVIPSLLEYPLMSIRLPFLVFVAILLLLLSFASAFDGPAATTPAGPEPKLVTLQSEKLMMSEALADVAKQTGIHVEDARGLPDQALQLDLKKVSFWEAVDTIATTAKARVNLYPTSGRIALAKRGANYRLPPISYDGRFRFSVKKVTTSRDLEVSDDAPGRGATNVAIEIAWD